MLRRADNVSIDFIPSLFRRKGKIRLTVGRKTYDIPQRMKRIEFNEIVDPSSDAPHSVEVDDVARNYWIFRGDWYWDNEGLTSDQVHALLVTKQQRRTEQINRAQAMVAQGLVPQQSKRRGIPDDIRQFVWTRDEGSCVDCSSTTELQFDHIIPIALGGANTVENLQVLCGPCNRKKGVSI